MFRIKDYLLFITRGFTDIIFLSSPELKNISGLMFQILQRVLLPSGHLIHPLG